VGGVSISRDARVLAGEVDLLVATPGRLQDHLTNTPGFKARLGRIGTLILV